jgi:hypothetical protein
MAVEGEGMRTLLTAASAMLLLAAPAAAATRNFGITDYSKIRVEGPYKVTLTTGVAPFAKASGSPTALDRIRIETRGDTLVVEADPNAWGGYPGQDYGPVEVSVGTHDLTNAALTGAGSLSINHVEGLTFGLAVQGSGAAEIANVAADQMTVIVAGTASARLRGRALKFTAAMRGLSSIDAANLTTHNSDIVADGSATIDAIVTDTAQVEASGPSTIRLSGRPTCTLKVSGSTSVSGCR